MYRFDLESISITLKKKTADSAIIIRAYVYRLIVSRIKVKISKIKKIYWYPNTSIYNNNNFYLLK